MGFTGKKFTNQNRLCDVLKLKLGFSFVLYFTSVVIDTTGREMTGRRKEFF